MLTRAHDKEHLYRPAHKFEAVDSLGVVDECKSEVLVILAGSERSDPI